MGKEDLKYELMVPQDSRSRNDILEKVNWFCADRNLEPPLSIEELKKFTEEIIRRENLPAEFSDFVTVLIGNELWKETVASVPFERRILLLPQCMRNMEKCPAELDELGLLCEQCGNCVIGKLQEEAESLGYVVLVAEGTTVVTSLIEQGTIDAVIGVSCLNVLEKAFPYMTAHAVPGIAIPLITAGCKDTTVDLDWLRNAIFLQSEEISIESFDISFFRTEVNNWFRPDKLKDILNWDPGKTEDICFSWLAGPGKRWRPFLALCAYKALNPSGDLSEIKKLAVSVECFHKASLIHDDIEDDDDFRYGEMTLHKKYGVPVALNAGDFLLGEGYRMISECKLPPELKERMLAVAVEGYRTLCLGQGEELYWMREPYNLSIEDVLNIFRKKTAPAFEVALNLGAICAEADNETCKTLKDFSEALGIAYQIKDDLEDFYGDVAECGKAKPSIILAIAFKNRNMENADVTLEELVKAAGEDPDIEMKAKQLYEHYRNNATRSLKALNNSSLKRLMHRITGRILSDV